MVLKAGNPARDKAIKEVTQLNNLKKKRLNVDIPESLHFDLKTQANNERLKLNELVERVLTDYLNSQKRAG